MSELLDHPKRGLGPVYQARLRRKLVSMFVNKVFCADPLRFLKAIPNASVDCIVVSPADCISEHKGIRRKDQDHESADLFKKLSSVIGELSRVLKPGGSCLISLSGIDSARQSGRLKKQSLRRLFHRLIGNFRASSDQNKHKQNPLSGISSRVTQLMSERGLTLTSQFESFRAGKISEILKVSPNHESHRALVFTKPSTRGYGHYFEPEDETASLGPGNDPAGNYRPWKCLRRTTEYSAASKHDRKTGTRKGRRRRSSLSSLRSWPKGKDFSEPQKMLISAFIKRACPRGGIVLDPFAGKGTSIVIAKSLGRRYIGIERRKEYAILARERLSWVSGGMSDGGG